MLDERKAAILSAVVQRYIETAQPVGSSHIVESTGIGVSSATVRNEMTLLEREGYLTQPHTSAGRVPTEKGYRFFVDQLGGPGELGASQVRQIRAFFSHAHGEIEQMLRETSQLLSKLTATTAVVVGEAGERATVRSAQLVGLGPRTFLAVVVLSTGSVIKRTIEWSREVDDAQLAAATAHLAAHLVGRQLGDLGSPSPTGSPGVDEVVSGAMVAIEAASQEESRHVYVDGASHIAGALEARETLQDVLVMLEQQLTVVTLLEDVLNRGLSVAIGSETGFAPLAECAVVVAPYDVGGEHAGTIGVLGPARMNYPEALAAVATVSRRLSRALTEGD